MTSVLAAARSALAHAHAPYSEYRVGAAIRTADGTIITGCNVENANFSNSLHAEELALGTAVSQGYQDFEELGVVADTGDVVPCGSCRQSLSEFCKDDFVIYCGTEDDSADGHHRYELGDLLPAAFRASHLEGEDAN